MTQSPRRSAGRSAPPALQAGDGIGWIVPRRPLLRRLRPIGKLLLMLPWTVLCGVLQVLLLLLPGGSKTALPRLYWRGVCAILDIRVRVVGAVAHATANGRPVVYVSNHSSWLDVLVLGAQLDASFTAKEEIARWPVIRTVARLGRTVYVRRQRNSTARERDEMRERLAAGDNLILFPEGTTSDGTRVLAFRSAFLSIAERPVTADGKPPIVQPISLVYDRLSGLPMGRATRPYLAWYGDMDMASHYWQLAQRGGMRASVLMHAPLDPRDFVNRKALAQAIWRASADGAAALRQNRPAQPAPAPQSLPQSGTPPIPAQPALA